MTYTLHEQTSGFTWMSICTKMKTNRVHTSLSSHIKLCRSSLLLFSCGLNDCHGPLNSATNLKKPKKNIFGFSIFERQEQKQTKQNLFGFSNSKLTRRLSKPKTKNLRDNQRETTEIFLVYLCFGKQK